MAKHSAARDQEIWELAQIALERLLAAGESGLIPKDIFGEEQHEFWTTGFLKRLTEASLVIVRTGMTAGPSHRAKTYFATAALGALVDNPSKLEELIWPRGNAFTPDPSMQESLVLDEETATDPAPDEQSMPTDGIAEQMKWISEKRALTEKVDALLKLSLATLQTLDALKAEIEGLKRAWE